MIVQTPVDEVVIPDEQVQQEQGKVLTKREIFLYRPDLLDEMDEHEFIEFQQPVFDEERRARQIAEEKLQKKKANQRVKNEKFKKKKQERSEDFYHPIIRPILLSI